jgi:hypothetical protein
MIGFTSEYTPKTGALGMSLVGGAGMLSTSIWQPVIGSWLDRARVSAIESGITEEAAEMAAGRDTLGNIMYFPLTVAILFSSCSYSVKFRGGSHQTPLIYSKIKYYCGLFSSF